MLDNKSVKKKYIDKIKKFIQHNESYFSKNNPTITDKEFDELKQSILELEKRYKFLDHEESPSKKIGYKPSKIFQKKTHKVPMLSLSNIFDREDLINFEKKIKITNYRKQMIVVLIILMKK